MWSLHLLGPPALRQGEQPLPLGVKKTWALLVALACGGRCLRPRLAMQLWPALDEASARRNLRRELARLREAGAEGLLQVDGDWLALHDGVDVDVRRFQAAVQAGDNTSALALWRGPLADGLWLGDAPEFDRWLETQREQLRGLWRSALVAEAERAPAEQALALWQTLLGDDPLQEQHHCAVMRLHAAAGRREAALAQYMQLKTLLRDELGLVPVADTEALARALRGIEATTSPAAAATPTTSPIRTDTLLPGELPFVGRSVEVAAMEAAWRAGRLIVIEGVGGVGKTRLALDFAAAHGSCALARCRSGDRDVPYAAWARALRALAGPEPTRAGLGTLPAWACDELARLLPELAESGAAPSAIRSDEERSRFFEASALGWQQLSGDNFDAVVLDDWHHADAASLAMLAFVVQRQQDRPGAASHEIVLLRPETGDDAAAHWRSLRDSAGALHLQLGALPPEVVLDLVRRLSGAREPTRFAARLQAATAGNPFFLHETLRHLSETGLLGMGADGIWQTPFDDATHDYRELPVPASVREAVLARVQRLGDASRRVLEAAALADEPFAPALLAPACALSELDVVLAIDLAVQAQLLREHEAGGYAFAHDLVQQALDAALTPERRRLVHRRLALGAEAAGSPAAVVAAHHEASGDSRRAVPHRLAAAEQAQRLHALPEAMAHWIKALDDGASAGQALRAHQGLMLAARSGCEFDTMRTHGEALQALAGGATLSADERADALIAVADNLVFGNQAAQALEMLEKLPAPLAEPLQGQALITRSQALRALGRIDDAKLAAQAALGLTQLQPGARAELLDVLTRNEIGSGNMPAARTHADAALALALNNGDEEATARARFHRGLTWIVDGDLPRAETELEQAADSFASRGSVYRLRGVLYNLAVLQESQSRHERALAAVQRGWDLRPPLPPGELWIMYRLAFVDAHTALGHLGAAWEHAQAAIAAVLERAEPPLLLGTTQCCLELLGLLGETGLARQLLAATGSEAVRGLRRASAEYWVAVAQFELTQGHTQAAQQALSEVPATTEIADVRVRARHALASAELRLAAGDVAAAKALLPGDTSEGMNDEMRVRALALRVRAETRTGALPASTLQAARAVLDMPSPHVPATLQLQRALAGGWPAAVPAHAEFVSTLAASLTAWPPQQTAFELNAR